MSDSNDESLRATTFEDFVGQDAMKLRLNTHIKAALAEKRPLEHILLAGPPGTGKTTMALLIADKLGDPITVLTMPIERKSLLLNLSYPTFKGGVLFLDEIHALPKKDQEMLLPILGKGVYVDSRGDEYTIPFLTVIGATTERDKLITPLYQRFVIKPEFEPYTDVQLGDIVARMAKKAGVEMSFEMAVELGAASGGIPRNAKQFVFAARALAATEKHQPTAAGVLDFCGIDADGLGEVHRRYLALGVSQGNVMGQKTITGMLQIPEGHCREVERLLIQKGFLTYSPRGRVITAKGVARNAGEKTELYVRR